MLKIFKKNAMNAGNGLSQEQSELERLQGENKFYKSILTVLEQVAEKAAQGDLSARITYFDEFGDYSKMLSNINKSYDLVDAFLREAGASLEHASDGKFYRIILEDGLIGDYHKPVEIINKAQQHMELSETSRKTEMIKLADNLEHEVKSAVDIVQKKGESMREKSEGMSESLSIVTEQANAVVQLSNDANHNVEACAAAVEEMSASAQEIFRQVKSSSESMNRAETEIKQTTEIVAGLDAAAVEIGDISGMIKDIASRTNLLALNATIEAARAGEFGKGFAVVASEVKNLATQTGEATDRVDSQITTIQEMARETAKAVENISKVIRESGEISNTVAAAAEEQLTATQEISQNVLLAVQATGTSSQNVLEVANKANEATLTAKEVSVEADEVSGATSALSSKVSSILSDLRSYEAFNRRTSERYPANQVEDCSVNINGHKETGKMLNISKVGVAISMTSAAMKDDIVVFSPIGFEEQIRSIVIGNSDGVLRLQFTSDQEEVIQRVI